jgi:phosphate transport system permease protein
MRDAVLVFLLRAAAGLSGLVVVVIVAFVGRESLPALTSIGVGPFLTDDAWLPTSGQFGMLPMVVGTLATTALALLLAVPLGLASAAWLRFYAPPPLAALYRRLVELLAGIPSVVYGLWGLTALVPLLARIEPPGASLLAGSLILALMVLPTIALITDAAFGAIPREILAGASALGTSRAGALVHLVVPAARSGIGTAVTLATGRALGETMAVLMVCGNVVAMPDSLLAPVRTLTANIALEMAYAMGDHRSALFISGLLLVVVVIALTLVNQRLRRGGLRYG